MSQKLFFCLLILCGFQANAQRDSLYYSNKYKVELGLNVTSVISNFVGNKADETITPGSYQLYAKFLVNRAQKAAIRIGLGGRFTQNKKVNSTTIFSSDYDNSFNARIGYEWRNYIARRWMVFYGADVLGQMYSKSVITTTVIDVTNKNNHGFAAGIGPHLGFQFALHKRIHIGTETAIYGLVQNDVEKISFLLSPNLNTKSQTQSGNVSFSAPKWVYLIVRF